MICLVVGGVLIGIFIGLILTNGITKQLGTEPRVMLDLAKRIAEGDLTVRLEAKKGKKAVGALAALKDMTEKLNEVMRNVQEAAAHVASSSAEISSSSQRLSSGTQNQASFLEET